MTPVQVMTRMLLVLGLVLEGSAAAADPLAPTVTVTGNTVFPTAKLLADTGPHAWVDTKGAIFQDGVERAAGMIAMHYWDHGFAQVAVEPAIDRATDTITLTIVEGPKFTMGAVRFTGKLAGTERKLMSLLTIKRGDVFSRSKIAGDRERVSMFFQDRSYAYATVLPLTKLDLKANTISLTYEIDPGEPSVFEAIDVIGNDHTSKELILDELGIAPGQPFHATRLEEGKQRLERLGYFTSVDVVTQRGSRPGMVRVTVEVDD